ncbi:hypothetical protein FKM82_011847 [Ascaphus truei]
MEGKGPYRIYDPGGRIPDHATYTAFQRLLNENAALKEKMEGIRSIGQGQTRDLFEAQIANMNNGESVTTPKSNQKTPPSGASSEFEILNGYENTKTPETRKSDPAPTLQREDDTLQLHLQRLESSLNMFAADPDKDRLLTHLSRMALDFNRLANKVNKNELRTSVLQTLCEQLRKENEDLRLKLEADWVQRSKTEQILRYENLELKKLMLHSDRAAVRSPQTGGGADLPAGDDTAKVENAGHQQAAKLLEKPAGKDPSVSLLKKVKVLEHQRTELLEVNKQWDQQFRSMKLQYEEKITSLRQKLSQALKSESEQEAERDRKQRDFDRKLLLARDKIENKESQIQKLESEMRELKQKSKFVQDQLGSISKQREYQEREISRLNKALEEALKMQGAAPRSPSFTTSAEDTGSSRHQELMTQNDILKQQVQIFEEDFQKERRDRERMNEEKEELKKQTTQLQVQLSQINTQLHSCQEDLQREKEHTREALRQQVTPVCDVVYVPALLVC